jgi:hypothetical protein
LLDIFARWTLASQFLQVEPSSTQQLRKSGQYAMLLSKAGATTDLRDFQRHLGAILSAFGNVQVRLTHLSQIIRHRIVSTTCFCKGVSSVFSHFLFCSCLFIYKITDKTHTAAYSTPSSAL